MNAKNAVRRSLNPRAAGWWVGVALRRNVRPAKRNPAMPPVKGTQFPAVVMALQSVLRQRST
ncbi:hypothetical protein [Actinomadura monticuli]|uniref:Uncharacterized protein n=1 Tax=Actinomadura monticuli TaxID=3097367 RepID=A0ABV4QHL5_9ACTN